MFEQRIEEAESAVAATGNISADQKAELLDLLARLRSALGNVEDRTEAESIARLAQASVHEAMQEKKKPSAPEGTLQGLTQSVEKFEASHPELVRLVADFSTFLANMGL